MNSPDPAQSGLPRYFHTLDAIRGLAALSIVFWHWHHFFFRGTEPGDFELKRLPLFPLFSLLYTNGWRAVDLFFCLSGFIFSWLYAEAIRNREISARQFFLLRFSRLYPLHALTLLIVAAGQALIFRHSGTFFVCKCNDFYHFILQVFMASGWGLDRGLSFNGPIWSVSVEVLCYAVFFLTCLLGLRRWWHLAAFACAGIAIGNVGSQSLSRGFCSFFIGSISFLIVARMARNRPSRRVLIGLGIVTVLSWAVIPFVASSGRLERLYRSYAAGRVSTARGFDVLDGLVLNLTTRSCELILFPLTLITLALWESSRGAIASRLAPLGQISYSTYLLHFPLQMLFISVTTALGVSTSFYYSPLSLFLFFATLIPLSMLSYRAFERPAQSMIRAWASCGASSDRSVRV